MSNVFGIADNILIAGFNKQDRDHDEMFGEGATIMQEIKPKTCS